MNEELYIKYNESLFKWCLSKTNNYNDAEDLLQEINYQLTIAFSRDVLIIDEERFVWKIAYYTWCKKVKDYEKGKNNVPLTDELSNKISDNGTDIFKQVEMIEIRDILINYINSLDLMSKKCIILYYYEDLSIKEISNTLKIKDNLVKYYLHKARNKIREELKKGGNSYE